MNRTTREAIATMRQALSCHFSDETCGPLPEGDGAQCHVRGVLVRYWQDADSDRWTAAMQYIDGRCSEQPAANADELRAFVLSELQA